MRKLIVITTLLILSQYQNTFSQNFNWIKYYFDNFQGPYPLKDIYANDFIGTSDGGYLLTGTTTDVTQDLNYFFLKVDSIGDTLFYHEGGSSSWDEGKITIETSDSNYIMATSTGELIKYSKSGNLMWQKFIPFQSTFAMTSIFEMNNSIYVLGNISLSSNPYQGLIFKLNSTGDSIATFSGLSLTGANKFNVTQHSSHEFIYTGWKYDSLNNINIPVITIVDTTGNYSNPLPIQTSQEDFGLVIKKSNYSGNYNILTTVSNMYQLDNSGNVIWSAQYSGGTFNRYLTEISNDLLLIFLQYPFYNEYYLAGQYYSTGTQFDQPFSGLPWVAGVVDKPDKIVIGGFVSDTTINDIKCYIIEYDKSLILSYNKIEANNHIKIYPNPVSQSESLNITLMSDKQVELVLSDIYGNIIKKQLLNNFEHKFQIKLPGLAAGIYFAHFYDLNHFLVSTEKIIVKD